MFLSEWREFPSAPCLAGKETWWQLASPFCWNDARPWHASEFVSFLVGLRTYQHPGIFVNCNQVESGGSTTVHICTQTEHRTTQSTQTIHRTTQSTQTIIEQHNRHKQNIEQHIRHKQYVEQHNRHKQYIEQHNRHKQNVEQHNRHKQYVEQHNRHKQ